MSKLTLIMLTAFSASAMAADLNTQFQPYLGKFTRDPQVSERVCAVEAMEVIVRGDDLVLVGTLVSGQKFDHSIFYKLNTGEEIVKVYQDSATPYSVYHSSKWIAAPSGVAVQHWTRRSWNRAELAYEVSLQPWQIEFDRSGRCRFIR